MAASASLATSVVEIFRERGDERGLVYHYHRIGNSELRDRHIEILLDQDRSPRNVVTMRLLQRRPDLIPPGMTDVVLAEETEGTVRAALLYDLERYEEAATVYCEVVAEALRDGRPFSAAYYIRTMVNVGLPEQFLLSALSTATADGDLWWQMRCLQELGWDSELAAFYASNAEAIRNSDNLILRSMLAEHEGHTDQAIELRRKEAAEGRGLYWFRGSERR